MKTYEFDIPGSTAPVHLIVSHDDNGDVAGVDFAGDAFEYDLAFAAMGGEPSEAARLHMAFSETEREKIYIGAGVARGRYNLSEESRVALTLALPQSMRASVIATMTSYQTRGYGMTFSNNNLHIIMMSIEDSNEIRRMLQNSRATIPFDLFRDAYMKLDWIYQKPVVDSMSSYRYEIIDILELARLSKDAVRTTIAHRWLWNASTSSASSRGSIANVVDMAISISNMIEDERVRVLVVHDILVQAGRMLLSDQAYAIGEILLGITPALVQEQWWDIARFREMFKDEDQWQRLQGVGRPRPGQAS